MRETRIVLAMRYPLCLCASVRGFKDDFFYEAVIADARANFAAALRLGEVVFRCHLKLVHQIRYVRQYFVHKIRRH